MYAADMCLEFKRKYGGELPGVDDEIIDQVTDVFKEFFPRDFNNINAEKCRTETIQIIN